MSRKRKAEGNSVPVQRKRNSNAISATPLSAFAAARAKASGTSSAQYDETRRHSLEQTLSNQNVQEDRPETLFQINDAIRAFGGENTGFHAAARTEPRAPNHTRAQGVDDEPQTPIDTETEEREDDELPKQQNILFSTWVPTSTNILSSPSQSERLRLTHGQTLTVLGCCKVAVTEGLAVIAGTVLTSDVPALEVITTSMSSLPAIKCLTSAGATIDLWQSQVTERGIGGLQRLSPLFGNILGGEYGYGSTFVKIISADDSLNRALLPLNVSPSWQKTINGLAADFMTVPSIVQICGPANCGKSTFAQLLVNGSISSPRARQLGTIRHQGPTVALLDLDPSKTDHSPPGQISLSIRCAPILSPQLARPHDRVIRSHAIGIDGLRENSAHYLDAVVDLLDCYRSLPNNTLSRTQRSRPLPLIVNCPPWYQGSGADLNIKLMQALQPDTIVVLTARSAKIVDMIQTITGERRIECLLAQPYSNAQSLRSVAEQREAQLLSYFHAKEVNGIPEWDFTPLTTRRPYQVSYRIGASDFAGVFVFGEVPVMYPNMLTKLLNGSLVSMIEIESDSAFEDRKIFRGEGDDIPYFTSGPRGYTDPFNPKLSAAIGIALIRGIDVKNHALQILTPVTTKRIAEIRPEKLVLAFGAFECPGWAYTEDHYYKEWAKKAGEDSPATADSENTPWVEEGGDDGKGLSGPSMQSWKTRRFQ